MFELFILIIPLGAFALAYLLYRYKLARKADAVVQWLAALLLVVCLGGGFLSWCVGQWQTRQRLAEFNTAVGELQILVTSTGHEDAEVVSTCDRVSRALKRIELSRLSNPQADAAKRVALEAELWSNHLIQMTRSAAASSVDEDTARKMAVDVEIGRRILPGLQRAIETYLNNYN